MAGRGDFVVRQLLDLPLGYRAPQPWLTGYEGGAPVGAGARGAQKGAPPRERIRNGRREEDVQVPLFGLRL